MLTAKLVLIVLPVLIFGTSVILYVATRKRGG